MDYEVKDFISDVIERSRKVPVLVDFWAAWCGPCKMLSPVLEKLAQANQGQWVLVKVNTETNQDMAAEYQIRSIPAVKLFVDGDVKAEFAGALPEGKILEWLAKVLPNKTQKAIDQVIYFISQGADKKALGLLQKILEVEPGNLKARGLMAQVMVFADPEKAMELVADINDHSELFDAAQTIRALARLFNIQKSPDQLPENPVKKTYLAAIKDLRSKNFDPALEKFIKVLQENRQYDEDGARKACIAIFKVLGEENDITKARRREFASALYV